jgi:hypothetical protein
MRNNYSINPCVALLLGTGLGLLVSVGVQKVLNKHYKATCHNRPEHNLIYTRGFLGDTYYCLHKAQLGIEQ